MLQLLAPWIHPWRFTAPSLTLQTWMWGPGL